MNYYERHLGDYAKDTAHLTMLEHGAYGLLMDRYYSTEQGIPADQAHRVARARSDDEKAAVDAVLAEFFTLVDGVWRKNRIEEEIAKASAKINAAKENGKKGGRPRNPELTQEKPTGFSLGSENETQTKALQTPDSIHQTPKKKTSSSPRGSRRCPPDFEVTAEMRSKAEAESPGVDIDRETTKFRDWEFAKARSDWPATWRNWIREAFDRLPRSQPSARPPPESFRAQDLRLATERVAAFTGRRPASPTLEAEVIDVTPKQLGR